MKEKDTEKQLKALEEAVRQEQETGGKTAKKHRESSSAAAKESHPLASFLIGLVLLGAGIFWVLNSFVVSFSWGSLWGGFGMNTSLATGLMLVPLLIGIGLLFFLDRKWIGWAVSSGVGFAVAVCGHVRHDRSRLRSGGERAAEKQRLRERRNRLCTTFPEKGVWFCGTARLFL